MRTLPKPPGKAVYTAAQSDFDWLRTVQKKLYERSWQQPDYVFRELWGLLTDLRCLRIALARVSQNRGSRSAGVDRLTARNVLTRMGAEQFLAGIRQELRHGTYRPSPVRRVLIPKQGQPGKFRPLGIPTVKDRVIQAAMKAILEPVFEADFYPVSYGFRPGKSAHGALEHLRLWLHPQGVKSAQGRSRRPPYQYAIEGDIKGCFDNISHHGLMNRIRKRCADGKINRLILSLLKAGILSEEQFLRTEQGTPQGGILSPLLANIALSVIEERYRMQIWPRENRPPVSTPVKLKNKAVWQRRLSLKSQGVTFTAVRYADDFIVLVKVPEGPDQESRARETAEREKEALAQHLRDTLNLELSETKTLVTPVTRPMRFLGHHVRVRRHPGHGRWVSHILIPKDKSQLLREKIKLIFKRCTASNTLKKQLVRLNSVLRGWGNYYRHAWGAKRVFGSLDCYAWQTILRWLRKKHRISTKRLLKMYGERLPDCTGVRWRDGNTRFYRINSLKVEQFRLGWLKAPAFAQSIYREPCA